MSKKSLSLCSRGTGNDRFTDMVVVFTIYGAHVGVYSSHTHCADCFNYCYLFMGPLLRSYSVVYNEDVLRIDIESLLKLLA